MVGLPGKEYYIEKIKELNDKEEARKQGIRHRKRLREIKRIGNIVLWLIAVIGFVLSLIQFLGYHK